MVDESITYSGDSLWVLLVLLWAFRDSDPAASHCDYCALQNVIVFSFRLQYGYGIQQITFVAFASFSKASDDFFLYIIFIDRCG